MESRQQGDGGEGQQQQADQSDSPQQQGSHRTRDGYIQQQEAGLEVRNISEEDKERFRRLIYRLYE